MESFLILDYLYSVALRVTVLMAAAAALLGMLRVKNTGARHAVWTLIAAAMIVLAAAEPLMPPLPVRVLNLPPAVLTAVPAASPAAVVPAPSVPARRRFPWQSAALGVYLVGTCWFLARLAYGYWLTLRMVRAGRPVEAGVVESDWVVVPATVGKTIVLPPGWRDWDMAKRRAVLAHERAHVRRHDWAAALLVALARSVYWFHPGAWWLERRVATLAELACDDEALREAGSREAYAEALVAIAAAVGGGGRRVVWEAMAMAKGPQVGERVDRILDETRELSRGISRWRWAAMAACAVPVVWLASAVHLARVEAAVPVQEPSATPPAGSPQRELAQQLKELETRISQAAKEQSQVLKAQVDVQSGMRQANLEMEQLQRHKLMLMTQLQNHMSTLNFLRASQDHAPHLLEEIDSLRKKLEAARGLYTENHPAVRELQMKIQQMEVQLNAGRRDSDLADVQSNMMDHEAAIAEIQRHLQEVNVQMDEHVRQLREIQEMHHQISSQNQQHYMELVREYERVRRAQSGTTGPALISRTDPEYPPGPEAQRIHGKVELAVTIGTDGIARDIRVLRSPDKSLDQKAIECAGKWRFRPAQRDGEPITAFATIEVNF